VEREKKGEKTSLGLRDLLLHTKLSVSSKTRRSYWFCLLFGSTGFWDKNSNSFIKKEQLSPNLVTKLL